MSKKPVYPGISVFSKSAYATFGKRMIGLVTIENKIHLMSLVKPARSTRSFNDATIGEESITLEFENEAGLDALLDCLKVAKKNLRKKKSRK